MFHRPRVFCRPAANGNAATRHEGSLLTSSPSCFAAKKLNCASLSRKYNRTRTVLSSYVPAVLPICLPALENKSNVELARGMRISNGATPDDCPAIYVHEKYGPRLPSSRTCRAGKQRHCPLTKSGRTIHKYLMHTETETRLICELFVGISSAAKFTSVAYIYYFHRIKIKY